MIDSALVLSSSKGQVSEPRIRVLLYLIQIALDLPELNFLLSHLWLT